MKIKKLGHCCLSVQVNNLTILTDPGNFSVAQNTVTGIDVILITHEHTDHLHVDSLKEVVRNNPSAQIITNTAVGKILADQGIKHTILESLDSIAVKSVVIEALDCKHEEVFEEFGQVQNTAYFIDNKLFYPGDSFCVPGKKVDILALPVAGPWCKIPEATRYALAVKPRVAFPVHDGMLQKTRIGGAHKVPEMILSKKGIQFVSMNEGDEREF